MYFSLLNGEIELTNLVNSTEHPNGTEKPAKDTNIPDLKAK